MLDFAPRQTTLKNNKTVTIRRAQPDDAQNLLDCVKTYIPQSNYIPKLASEIRLSLQQEIDWIQSFLSSHNSLLLVAEYDNQIIGNIDLNGSRRKIMEHTAAIGMGMLSEWRNSGLGTALLSATIDWAQNNPILELIWLQVYSDNLLGLNLYKKMGFQPSGLIKNFFKRDNQYAHSLTMSLHLK